MSLGRLPHSSMLEMAVPKRQRQDCGPGQGVDERHMWFLNEIYVEEAEGLTLITGQGKARIDSLDVLINFKLGQSYFNQVPVYMYFE